MKKHRRRPRNSKSEPLSKLVEREVVSSSEKSSSTRNDSLDPDLGLYVESFLHDFMNIKPLPPTSLLTPESAQRALEVLTETQEHIDRKLKTARALRGLLEQKQRE